MFRSCFGVSLVILALLLGVAPVASAVPIGVVTASEGDVQILRGRTYVSAARGVDIEADDIVETGTDAAAQLDLDDGSVLKLGAQTRVALAEYRLDANNNIVAAAVDVLSGWMRFAVAKLRPDRSFGIHTPTLTIGIRGTEGTIEAESERGALHLTEGAVDVTPTGSDSQTAAATRINAGEYIQRARGAPLLRQGQPPREFLQRLPPGMRDRLIHRAQELRQRGVPPRVIREMTREDARRFLQRHPQLRKPLRQRFESEEAAPPERPNAGPPASREEMMRRRQHLREERLRRNP
jgi:hypothetical protein